MTAGSTPPPAWTRVRAAYEALCELPAGERAAALLRVCGDDASLRAEVERMLAHDSGDGDPFLATPAARLPLLVGVDRPTFDLAAGTVVGGFRIVQSLGHGGMGAVYEAEQASPMRRVALKVLRAELATAESLRRFDLEVDTLARLQHPDIARVYAAGIHEVNAQGVWLRLPWFAMELVSGARDLVAHARTLEPRARLALLARVAEAVHHAHLRGIVHRDLKPGNVLVDAHGEPKVIDFGVARSLERGGNDTRTGALLGTPRYMAPEQRRVDGDVDARCDVWALGMLAREVVAAHLGRELEWVLAKACAEAPAQRYASAQALADDLRRVLAGEVVLAAPHSRFSELTRLVRRHRLLVVATCLVMLSLGAGLWIAVNALERERRANEGLAESKREADAGRAAAEQASAKARAELGLRVATLEQLRRTVTAAKSRSGGELTLRQLVAELAADVERKRTDPLARGATCNYLADLALADGDLPQAESLMRRALQALDDAGQFDVTATERAMGLCGLAEIQRMSGRLAECQETIAAASQLAEQHGLDDSVRSAILRRRVLLALSSRDAATAARFAAENVALRRRCFGARAPETVEAMLDLGKALCEQQLSPEHVAELERACSLASEVFGSSDQRTLGARISLGVCHGRLGKWPDSASTLEAVAADCALAYGAEHPQTAIARTNLAHAWRRIGKPSDAAAEFARQHELAARHQAVWRRHPADLLDLLRLAAQSYLDASQPAEAVRTLQPACRFAHDDDERSLSRRAECALDCARAMQLAGDAAAARTLLTTANAALADRLAADHRVRQAIAQALAKLE